MILFFTSISRAWKVTSMDQWQCLFWCLLATPRKIPTPNNRRSPILPIDESRPSIPPFMIFWQAGGNRWLPQVVGRMSWSFESFLFHRHPSVSQMAIGVERVSFNPDASNLHISLNSRIILCQHLVNRIHIVFIKLDLPEGIFSPLGCSVSPVA